MRALLTALTLAIGLAANSATAADIPRDMDIDTGSLVVSRNELVCLALNDYWESRGEPLEGRVAVAQVVLNRAMDRKYPTNLCDVVKQSRSGAVNCQFSWNCDSRGDHPEDAEAWRDSVALASAMLNRSSGIIDPTGGAKWYHSVKIKPAWSNNLRIAKVIKGHVFYHDPQSKPRWDVRSPGSFADWTERYRGRNRKPVRTAGEQLAEY